MSTFTRESVMQAVQQNQVRFINLEFTDITGMVKNITVPVSQLDKVLDRGIWFDGSSIEGFARVSESDMYLFPDLSTFAIFPWQSNAHQTARMICDVHTPDGELFAGAPRSALARVMQECTDMGFEFRVGPELEFFLFGTDGNGMPIMSPISDLIGLNRQIAVLIFQFGDGYSNLLWPTGFMVIVCAMVKIPLSKYFRWIIPFFLMSFVLQAAFVMGAIAMNYGPF